jgi:hypothetical protein
VSQEDRSNRRRVVRQSKWRLVRFIFGGVFCGLVLGILIIAIIVFRVPPPPEVRIDSLSAQRLDEEFRQATAAAETGTPSEVRADEIQINSKLQQLLQPFRDPSHKGGNTVKDVKIKVLADRLAAYVLIDYHGRDLAFQVTGKVHTENGYVQFEPESAALGALRIPKSRVQAAAKQLLDAPKSPLKYRLPSNMSDIEIVGGQIVFAVK